MKKEKYIAPMIVTHCVLLDGDISNCSACLVPEGASNDIMIQEYIEDTETKDLYF